MGIKVNVLTSPLNTTGYITIAAWNDTIGDWNSGNLTNMGVNTLL